MALSSQARLGSLSTRNAVRTQFYNHTSLDVAVLWLDYDGNEVRQAGRDSNTSNSRSCCSVWSYCHMPGSFMLNSVRQLGRVF